LPDAQSPSTAQVVLQAVAPHVYAPQDCVVRAGHEPAPAQLAGSVSTPFVQEAPRHWVAPPGYPQAVALDPLQVPPQTEPSVAQAAREPCGAPELTVVQVPTLLVTSHAWHWPLQALSQQTPSTQAPEAHSPFPPQEVPCDLMKAATTVCAAVTFVIV
jgi:hypothetical protein